MKIAKFYVSEGLLLDLLALPEGTRIIDIRTNDSDHSGMSFVFLAGSDQLRDMDVGELIPIIRPIFETETAECGHIKKISLRDWGYQDYMTPLKLSTK